MWLTNKCSDLEWKLLWCEDACKWHVCTVSEEENPNRWGGGGVVLPSRGVRLEPPFFPSSPCCEYCFRRFWALRMVPGPMNTWVQRRRRRRKRSERSRQPGNRRRKRELGGETQSTTHTAEHRTTGDNHNYRRTAGDKVATRQHKHVSCT